MIKKQAASLIFRLLKAHYPKKRTVLKHSNPFQLLIATILSAQCTDKRVNEVAGVLFAKLKKPQDFVSAPLNELEKLIRPTGFYRNKAKNIQGCCNALLKYHWGEVPSTLDELVALPGVGRKTANVVLGNAFGVPGIVVDTHVRRVSQRLELTQNSAPTKIEKDLMSIIHMNSWIDFSFKLILHGRALCKARRPVCNDCFLAVVCPYPSKS